MPTSVNTRLDELEIKASYSEDALEQLNQVVIRQQGIIDALLREVAELRRLQAVSDAGDGHGPGNEAPPHY